MNNTSKIFIALDNLTAQQANAFITQISPADCGLKIGKELFTLLGPDFVREQIERGFSVFLDLKFHDIPNTVAKAVASAAALGVDFLTVHALGGSVMMKAAAEANHKVGNPLQLLAVTVLTSHAQTDIEALGFDMPLEQLVKRLALLAADAGINGIVCAASDVPVLREQLNKDCCFVTPGIRLDSSQSAQDDQARVMTPKQAINAGANYLVIGRPITQAENPIQVLHEINAEVAGEAI